MNRVTYLAVGAALLCSQLFAQESKRRDSVEDQIAFATNLCLPKGGFGVINKNLYIVLKSNKNELITSAGKKWTGQSAAAAEVGVYFDGDIWSPQALPIGFDLSKAVIVSFESDKVRFFDFAKMRGGYYLRIGPS
jgi:hypothetical protein